MTEREPSEGEATPDSAQPPESPPTSTHLRPLPSPEPDRRLFATPARPPATRPPPPRPKPGEKPARPLASDRPSFPVAKPPPGIPLKPPAPVEPERPPPEPVAEPDESQAPETLVVTRRGSLYGYVLYLALAFGTFPLPGEVRYVLLWTMLIGLGAVLLFFDEGRPLGAINPLRLSWGAGVGFVLGLPVMLTASRALARTSLALLPLASFPALFQALVLTWPLGETLFYRGAVQREHGLVVASLTAGLGNLLLYWPEAGGVFAVLFVAVTFATALAFIYSYVRLRYGLAAAYACQVVTNLMLIFLPRFLAPAA